MDLQQRNKTMKTFAFALVATMAAGSYPASSSGPEVQTAASPSTPLAEYQTFSFGYTENPPASYQSSSRSLEVEHRVRDLIGAALREKGYVEDNTNPNFVVRFGAGSQQVDTETFMEADPERSAPDNLNLGQIKVDIFDASTKTEVWRGSAISQIDPSKDIDNGLLQRAVQGVFATFPARSMTDSQPTASTLAVGGAR
jgi:hypothetical protein